MGKNILFTLFLICLLTNTLESRLYFIHVPKTGGTTMRLLLEMQLSSDEIYPHRNIKTAVEPIKEELVSGHLPYSLCKVLDPNFNEAFKITILREPVERYLSFLRSKKKADPSLPDLESVLNLRQSPDQKYREGLLDNALCRYLAFDSSLEGQALLESAKQNLLEFDCVIFFDRFTQDVTELFLRLEIDFNSEDIPKINTTEPQPVSPELLENVRNLNLLDIELYKFAKENLSNKTTRYPLRTSTFGKVIQESASIDYTFDQPLLGSGWTYRDAWGNETDPNPIYRWVMNYPAKIYFNLEKGKNYTLQFRAWPITGQVRPHVKINDHEIEITRTNNDKFSLYNGMILKEYLTSQPAEISFYSDISLQFRDVFPSDYNRNHPPLSFALNRIQIDEVSP